MTVVDRSTTTTTSTITIRLFHPRAATILQTDRRQIAPEVLVELVVRGELEAEEIWRDLPSVHAINRPRGPTQVRRLNFAAQAPFRTRRKSATPTEVRREIRQHGPPPARDSPAIRFLTIDPHHRIDPPRRVLPAIRCAYSVVERMREAVARVLLVVTTLAELHSARATADVLAWAVEEATEAVEEEVVADDAKRGRESTLSTQKDLDPDTTKIAAKIKEYNPDQSWDEVND
jgi:hypothetical protein